MRISLMLMAALLLKSAVSAGPPDDGYITANGNRWTLGTSSVERVVARRTRPSRQGLAGPDRWVPDGGLVVPQWRKGFEPL